MTAEATGAREARLPRPISQDDAAAAWARIEPRLDRSGECWLWTGPMNEGGYGLADCGGKTRRVHRIAFAHFKGDTDMHLDHLCRNRSCANPAHLDPVTLQENSARGYGPPSWALRDNTCKAGHKYEEGSYRVMRGGWRKCLVCKRQWNSEWLKADRSRNPEKHREADRAAWARDPDKHREQQRAYRARRSTQGGQNVA